MSAHTLVVHEDDGERSYFIEHAENCPFDHDDSFVIGGKFYRCDVGEIWVGGGEYSVTNIENLAPGRYEVHAEHSHTPSTVNGPAEWDAWIEVDA